MLDYKKSKLDSKYSRCDIRKRVNLAAEIFAKYGDEIKAIIDYNIKNKSEADDVYQDFFVSIVHKPIPSNVEDIHMYLFRAISNDVINLKVKSKKIQDRVQRYAEGRKDFLITEDPQNIAIRLENTKRMFQLIESRLAKREAEVVLQRYGQGFSTKDTAKRLQVNKRNVSRYLSVALKKMREFIPQAEDEKV